MDDLFAEMERCRTVAQCRELAGRDAYGEYEEATGWHACLDTLFVSGTPVQVLGDAATLTGFDLLNDLAVVAICRRGKAQAKVTPDSLVFPTPAALTRAQRLWLRAWLQWSRG